MAQSQFLNSSEIIILYDRTIKFFNLSYGQKPVAFGILSTFLSNKSLMVVVMNNSIFLIRNLLAIERSGKFREEFLMDLLYNN